MQAANYALQLILLPYLVRVLGLKQYGVLAFSLAIIQYGVTLTDYGFNLTAAKSVAQQQSNKERVSNTFWSVMLCKTLLAFIVLVVLIALTLCVPRLHKSALVLLACYPIIIGNVLQPVWLLQGLEQMGALLTCTVIAKAVILPITFLVVVGPRDAWIAGIVQGGASLGAGLLTLVYVFRQKFVFWKRPSFSEIAGQYREGFHVFMSIAAVGLYSTTNSVILGFTVGSTAVGIFAAADKIRQAVQGLILPVQQAVYPRVNALMVSSREQAFSLIKKVLLIQGFGTLCLAGLLFAFAPLIVRLAYGGAHAEIIVVLRTLAVVPFIVGISNVLGIQLMLPLGMNRLFSQILVSAGILNVVMLIPLSRALSAWGGAISMVTTECFILLAMSVAVRSEILGMFSRKEI
jgi:O-antigen/teichoic acid export membrane protein